MNNLVIVSHPDKKSFCYNGIFQTILDEIKRTKENLEIIGAIHQKLYKFNFFVLYENNIGA